jgi:hypothetical protein
MPVNVPKEKLSEFCRKWRIKELALFGSVLTDDFSNDSDIDILVGFSEEVEHTLFDLVRMEGELDRIFGRKVDLVSRRGIESSRNYLRREAILKTAEAIYVA